MNLIPGIKTITLDPITVWQSCPMLLPGIKLPNLTENRFFNHAFLAKHQTVSELRAKFQEHKRLV